MYIYKRVTEIYKRVSTYDSTCWAQEQIKPHYDDRNQNSSFRGQISGKGQRHVSEVMEMCYILNRVI